MRSVPASDAQWSRNKEGILATCTHAKICRLLVVFRHTWASLVTLTKIMFLGMNLLSWEHKRHPVCLKATVWRWLQHTFSWIVIKFNSILMLFRAFHSFAADAQCSRTWCTVFPLLVQGVPASCAQCSRLWSTGFPLQRMDFDVLLLSLGRTFCLLRYTWVSLVALMNLTCFYCKKRGFWTREGTSSLG